MDIFEKSVTLFECAGREEVVRIECAVGDGGELVVLQESAGTETQWCFGEAEHRMETVVAAPGVRRLCDHFQLESVQQVPLALRMEYTGLDCCAGIRDLLKQLGIPYELADAPA